MKNFFQKFAVKNGMADKFFTYLQNAMILLGISLITIGIIKGVFTYFENWKYVLSDFAKIILYWKTYLCLIAGVIFILIGLNFENKK